MKVLKCDRCGKIYDEELRNDYLVVKRATMTSIDLCESCYNELNTFLNKKVTKAKPKYCYTCKYFNKYTNRCYAQKNTPLVDEEYVCKDWKVEDERQ